MRAIEIKVNKCTDGDFDQIIRTNMYTVFTDSNDLSAEEIAKALVSKHKGFISYKYEEKKIK